MEKEYERKKNVIIEQHESNLKEFTQLSIEEEEARKKRNHIMELEEELTSRIEALKKELIELEARKTQLEVGQLVVENSESIEKDTKALEQLQIELNSARALVETLQSNLLDKDAQISDLQAKLAQQGFAMNRLQEFDKQVKDFRDVQDEWSKSKNIQQQELLQLQSQIEQHEKSIEVKSQELKHRERSIENKQKELEQREMEIRKARNALPQTDPRVSAEKFATDHLSEKNRLEQELHSERQRIDSEIARLDHDLTLHQQKCEFEKQHIEQNVMFNLLI